MNGFGLAEVRSINEALNKIKIRDLYTNVVYDVDLNNHTHFQSMPSIKDIVFYCNYDDKIIKIIKVWQIDESQNRRSGEFLLKSGELQLQGIYGQYIYFDNVGTIKFVDSTMLNEFELNLDGYLANLKRYQLTTYDGIRVDIGKDIKVYRSGGARITLNDSGEPEQDIVFEATINDDGIKVVSPKVELTITKDGVVTLKAEKVNLGNTMYGDIVTSGPNGTLPICPITGSPIPGSKKCGAEK